MVVHLPSLLWITAASCSSSPRAIPAARSPSGSCPFWVPPDPLAECSSSCGTGECFGARSARLALCLHCALLPFPAVLGEPRWQFRPEMSDCKC